MKRKSALPLLSLLVLTSCGMTPNDSVNDASTKDDDSVTTSDTSDISRSDDITSGSSKDDTSDDSSSVEVPPIDTNSGDKTQIYETLVAAATCGSYTIAYDEDDGNGGTTRLEDSITPNYIDRKFSKGGYILLKSYNEKIILMTFTIPMKEMVIPLMSYMP